MTMLEGNIITITDGRIMRIITITQERIMGMDTGGCMYWEVDTRTRMVAITACMQAKVKRCMISLIGKVKRCMISLIGCNRRLSGFHARRAGSTMRHAASRRQHSAVSSAPEHS